MLPNSTPNSVWNFTYALFQGGTGNLELIQRKVVGTSLHYGSMTGNLGDFSFAIRRQGSDQGRVALAFGCDGQDGHCTTASPKLTLPIFAIQTDGPGVL